MLKALAEFKNDQVAENEQLESMRANERSLKEYRDEIVRLRRLLRGTSNDKKKSK